MVRIALAPCSPFSVTPELMRATAELAERLDVRLHTHLAEDPDEDRYAVEAFGCRTIEHFEDVGWGSDRVVGGALHLSERRRDRAAGRVGHRRRALPELEHAHRRRRHRAGARVPRRGRAGRPRVRRFGVDRLGVALDGGPRRAPARPLARRARGDGRARRARDRHARVGRRAWARRRARRARARRGRRPRVLAARRRRVRRRARRSGRGVAALRTGGAAPHGGERPCRSSKTARSQRPASRRCCARHRTISARIQADL